MAWPDFASPEDREELLVFHAYEDRDKPGVVGLTSLGELEIGYNETNG